MKVTVLFGVDDTHPFLPNDEEKFKEKLKLLESTCSDYGLKATHFVPSNYIQKEQSFISRAFRKLLTITGQTNLIRHVVNYHKGNPYSLDKHGKWANHMLEMRDYRFFSMELHGYYHFNFIKANAEEFLFLPENEIEVRINNSIKLFEEAGFYQPRVLSPPGWAATSELLSVLKKKKIAIAGNMHNSDKMSRENIGPGLKASPLEVQNINGVVNVPRNWDIHNDGIDKAEQLIESSGFLSIHSHYENIGVTNGIIKENIDNLKTMLDSVQNNYDLDFKFFREVIR